MMTIPKIIGVVHLLPLPGSPNFSGSVGAIVDRAVQDCGVYEQGGVMGVIVENFGDVPFAVEKVPPVTVASMTFVASELRRQFTNISFGINVLRNDAESALSIATVVGAEFVRVNVHVGAVVADQGIIQGKAYQSMRLRKNLDSHVLLFADVGVKHSSQIGDYGLEQQAADALERGMADAIILTGSRTGVAVDMEELRALRRKFRDARIIIGSGANPKNAAQLLKYADSVIVGTAVKVDRVTSNPVDGKLLREFLKAAG